MMMDKIGITDADALEDADDGRRAAPRAVSDVERGSGGDGRHHTRNASHDVDDVRGIVGRGWPAQRRVPQ
jgi:hypothetical protein